MNRLQEHYEDVIRPEMLLKFNYRNIMQLPEISKINVHITYKNIGNEKNHIYPSNFALELITGQKSCGIKAKKSMASFKVRKGLEVGCKVTLRNGLMYDFLDRLVHIVLPRIRDFQGISIRGFDGRGNYSFGIRDFLAFQEIESDYDLFDGIYGMDITIVTTAETDLEGAFLLSAFQIPFVGKFKKNKIKN